MNLETQWAFWPKKSWHWKSEFDINEEVFEALTWYQYQLHIMSADTNLEQFQEFRMISFMSDVDTFKEYETFKFQIFICVEFCRQT